MCTHGEVEQQVGSGCSTGFRQDQCSHKVGENACGVISAMQVFQTVHSQSIRKTGNITSCKHAPAAEGLGGTAAQVCVCKVRLHCIHKPHRNRTWKNPDMIAPKGQTTWKIPPSNCTGAHRTSSCAARTVSETERGTGDRMRDLQQKGPAFVTSEWSEECMGGEYHPMHACAAVCGRCVGCAQACAQF